MDMNYFRREIDASLREWANEAEHKPLLVRGARKIGKTTAIRHLAENFESYVELNFEEDDSIGGIFDGDFNIDRILAEIELHAQKTIEPGRTLLFLDEIQLCPRAISSLRYFFEKKPELHVAATGSLLEFAFEDMAEFGVGRIRNVFMHPMSFREFVCAIGGRVSLEHARKATFERPLSAAGHERMLGFLKTFMLVGGMPAAVRKYAETRSYLAAQKQHRDILVSLRADFGKYRKRVPAQRIDSVLNSVLNQISEKFTYTNSMAQISYRQSKECTTLLEMARLIYRVDACRGNGIPLGCDTKENDNKSLASH